MAKNCPWCFIKCSHINSSHRSIEIVLKCNFPNTRNHQIFWMLPYIINGNISKIHKAILFRVTSDFFDLSSLLTFAVDSREEGKFDCFISYRVVMKYSKSCKTNISKIYEEIERQKTQNHKINSGLKSHLGFSKAIFH